ncbi:MAG: glycosyltransferase [Ignavibacteria bacterium]|nr:glycosyltransferase [Ignavibacteria bacterium]
MSSIIEILKKIEQRINFDPKVEFNKYLINNPSDQDAITLELILNLQTITDTLKSKPKLVNLGCGNHFHKDWINIDFNKTGENVIQYDLLNGIPFEDNTADVIYHSHLLEHFPKAYAPIFIKECYRVLKPGGIIRVVVPNLEEIVKLYLENLNKALEGDVEASIKYHWILLELFDQMVRNKSGGEMLEYWKQYPLPGEEFIYQRVGNEAKINIYQIRERGETITPEEYRKRKFQKKENPSEIGKFRLSGEVHQWMYDRYSLGLLLKDAGFIEIEVVTATKSRIPNFNSYYLDINPDGTTRKPDSLFMEAVKPQQIFALVEPINKDVEKLPIMIKENFEANFPKVVHLSFWDRGGAGIAALRLHLALLRLGVDSKFLTLHKDTSLKSVYRVKRKEFAENWKWADFEKNWHTTLKQLYPNRPKDLEIFTPISSLSDLTNNEHIENADIINFHWVSTLVDFNFDVDIFRNKKIVWTLHDENPYTGGCHYTSGCELFKSECKKCPQLASNLENDLSNQQFKIKKEFYKKLDLTIVTPSRWLARRVKESKLLSDKNVFVIPNGFPIGIYQTYDRSFFRRNLNLPNDAYIILFGAEYQTKRKGFHLFEELLNEFPKHSFGEDIVFAIFGNVNYIKNNNQNRIIYLGYINEPLLMAMVYSAVDMFLFMSTEDNLPNTVIESILCGTPVVAFDIGGVGDIIENKKNGWLAKPFDLKNLIEGILFFKEEKNKNNHQISKFAQSNYCDIIQAYNYLELYTKLIVRNEQDNFENYFNFIRNNIKNEIDTGLLNKKLFLLSKELIPFLSGLDEKILNKTVIHNKLPLNEYFNLIVTHIIFANSYFPSNIIILSEIGSPNLPDLSKLINQNIFLVDFENKNIREKSNLFENVESICISPDQLEIQVSEYHFYLGFAYFKLTDSSKEHNNLEKLVEILSKSLKKHQKIWFFIEFEINEVNIDYLKKFLGKFLDQSFESYFENYFTNKKTFLIKEINNDKEITFLAFQVTKSTYVSKYSKINYLKKKNNPNYPKISIITPNLNQGDFIQECIESILSQNYPNLEYFIIDGGSTDKSVQIIKKYSKYLSGWVSEKDNGQYDAINKGFSRATGEILAWLNADDFYLPGSLFFVAEVFATFNNCLWLTNSKITSLSVENFLQTNWGEKFYSYEKILSGKYDSPFIQQEGTFWRRSLWEMSGSYVETNYSMASDLELWCRFFRFTNLYTISVPLAVFRFQPNSKTGKWMDKYNQEAKLIVERENNFASMYKINTKHQSIPISLVELFEKGGGDFLAPIISKVTNEYKNLNYQKNLPFDEIEFESWIEELEEIEKFFKGSDKKYG